MKTTTIIVLLLLFLGSPIAQGQDLLDALKQTAEMHNEANGGEIQNNAEELTEEQRERQEQWNREWEEKKAGLADFFNNSPSKEANCLALLTMYLYEYFHLVQATDNASNCKLKYDLYGLQLLTLTTGQTLMYCAEDLAKLSQNEQEAAVNEFYELLRDNLSMENYEEDLNKAYAADSDFSARKGKRGNEVDRVHKEFYDYMGRSRMAGFYNVYDRLLYKYLNNSSFVFYNVVKNQTELPGLGQQTYTYIWLITNFLRPDYFIYRTLKIGQKMEALGCGG